MEKVHGSYGLYSTIIVTCPYCGQLHKHSLPLGDGVREADCLRGQYKINMERHETLSGKIHGNVESNELE
jgi:hypothetical protein